MNMSDVNSIYNQSILPQENTPTNFQTTPFAGQTQESFDGGENPMMQGPTPPSQMDMEMPSFGQSENFDGGENPMMQMEMPNYDDNSTPQNFEVKTFPLVESMYSSQSSFSPDKLPFKFLFGPLPVSYCLLFYILSFFAFILFILAIIGLIIILIRPPKGMNWTMIATVVFGIILYFVIYLLYRLLFNMCAGNNV